MNILDKLQVRKTVAIVGVVCLMLSLVPMMWVSIYNHPTGDDIVYGLEAHQAWEETGSIVQTLIAAAQGVASDYYRWQGTFAALFIMRLQPTVFDEGLYFVTPFIVIGLILGGLLYALKKIARYIIPMDRWDILSIWSILSFVMIQWVHMVGDAFYWFNGAVYYGGFLGVLLFGVGAIIEWCNTRKTRYIPVLIFIAILIGGSNYITLLISLISVNILLVFGVWKKLRGYLFIGVIDAVLLVCLLISAMAPGNEQRKAATYASLSAVEAILRSLSQGFAYIEGWANGWWMLGFVFLLPTMIHVIKGCKFTFRYPGIVIAFLYGVFCAMQCPTMYAEASTGPARVLNVIWYGLVLFSYLAMFYGLGWIYRKMDHDIITDRKTLIRVWLFVTMMLLVVQCGIGFKNGSIKNMTTMKAISDITSGRAKSYDLEYRARLEILESSDLENIVFAEYANKPKTVYVGDYSPNTMQGSNQSLAKWYKKNSVRVEYEQ